MSGPQLNGPYGLRFDAAGNLDVVNRASNTIETFNGTTGAFLSNLTTGLTNPSLFDGYDLPGHLRIGNLREFHGRLNEPTDWYRDYSAGDLRDRPGFALPNNPDLRRQQLEQRKRSPSPAWMMASSMAIRRIRLPARQRVPMPTTMVWPCLQ